MKKLISVALVGCMAVSLAACGSAPSSSAPAANTTSTPASTPASEASSLEGAVTTGGSTSVEKVILALQESFMASNSGVDVTYDPTGSGAGITGASEGTLDIGLSSRALKDEETASGLVGTTFALDGIAIIVNNENTVADLSLEQIKGLADGTITNWSEVGGPDAPVVLIGREAGSGTRDGFESIVGVEDVCVYEQELTSTGAVIAAVAAANTFIPVLGFVLYLVMNQNISRRKINRMTENEEQIFNQAITRQMTVLPSAISNEFPNAL